MPTEGFGDETALYEEGFTQEAFESLDVMWVVDNSGSMGEELDQVRSNFASFIDVDEVFEQIDFTRADPAELPDTVAATLRRYMGGA